MSEQKPLNHQFNMKTSAKEVMRGLDLSGKIVLMTGGYGGIGLESARLLAGAGAELIVPARRTTVAEQALAKVPHVKVHEMDLMNPESIHAFADWVKENYQKIDLLINSAGIMYVPLSRNARGVESHMQANHFGHFQLTLELLVLLSAGSRIINISSRAQADGGFVMNYLEKNNWNWQDESGYTPKKAYDQSKVANVLFTVGLEKRLAAHDIHSFAVHPGAVPLTGIGRHVFKAGPSLLRAVDSLGLIHLKDFFDGLSVGFDLEKGFRTGRYRYLKSISQGAATMLWAATSPELVGKGGLYLEDVNIACQITAGDSGLFGVRPWSNNPELAQNLWEFSEDVTEVYFSDCKQAQNLAGSFERDRLNF